MARVWNAIVARAEAAGPPQIVALLCHSYTMADAAYPDRLAATFDDMRATAGAPVTASEAKALYDAGGAAASASTQSRNSVAGSLSGTSRGTTT